MIDAIYAVVFKVYFSNLKIFIKVSPTISKFATYEREISLIRNFYELNQTNLW